MEKLRPSEGWIQAADALPEPLRSLGLRREAVGYVVVVKFIVFSGSHRIRAGFVQVLAAFSCRLGQLPALGAGQFFEGLDVHSGPLLCWLAVCGLVSLERSSGAKLDLVLAAIGYHPLLEPLKNR